MKTQDLITAMAADAMPRPQVGALVARWFLPVLALSGLVALLVLGVRTDLAAAMAAPVTAMKSFLPLIVALAAGFAVLRRADPARSAGWLVWPLVIVAGLAALWFTTTLAGMPADRWWPTAKGQTLFFCLIAIPVIALLPLAVLIAALRSGASTAPMRSGALAGLAAGAGAAAIYAFHCTEDSPLFFLCWYSLGILAVSVAGAWAGRRWLRW
ncbi:NrsF family protein [Paracoccus tegillarcae]|uniref:DUF1109 domain-containing protein n=1 Tax=Paracoccus tegillarcae TaxID=1529068 RepID=A0A2K9EUN4_9RHOB|nr:DUF1109 domain-containing protein [Paracoccus tegillarcae]AUH32954.1 DUF1109 domain-containing protein [Paracoccus tegillarcae]